MTARLPLRRLARLALACGASLLLGCAALPDKPARPVVYDFGPGPLSLPPPATSALPALTLAEIEAPAALEGTAMVFRLAYADATQLRPYALARWSMPPAQLLHQRVREGLEAQRPVLNGVQPGSGPLLRIELEEFVQLFDSPERSSGLVRLRATLLKADNTGEQLLAQRRFVMLRPAASPDAPGGVRALSEATEALVQQLAQWLAAMR